MLDESITDRKFNFLINPRGDGSCGFGAFMCALAFTLEKGDNSHIKNLLDQTVDWCNTLGVSKHPYLNDKMLMALDVFQELLENPNTANWRNIIHDSKRYTAMTFFMRQMALMATCCKETLINRITDPDLVDFMKNNFLLNPFSIQNKEMDAHAILFLNNIFNIQIPIIVKLEENRFDFVKNLGDENPPKTGVAIVIERGHFWTMFENHPET